MVPPAWRCLIRQAERPDQVAFAIVCPRGAPLPGGGRWGGLPPPTAAPRFVPVVSHFLLFTS